MDRLLIVVDMQNDFVTGALGSADAAAAARRIAEKLRSLGGSTAVIFTQDTHGEDYLATREGKHLPVAHCIKNTDGWRILPELLAAAPEGYRVFEKSTFGGTALIDAVADLLAENSAATIELAGVCTDICVVSNALLLKAFFPDAEFCVDAACCAGTSPENHAAALRVLQSCHIVVR